MPIPIGAACRGEREARFPAGRNDAVFRKKTEIVAAAGLGPV